MADTLDRHEVEKLIFAEARCLDDRRFEDWLALYTADATYWIPSWKSQTETVDDTGRELSYLYLDHAAMEDYVVRMQSGTAIVADPPLRTTRLITNLLIDEGAADIVSTSWMLHTFRRNENEIFSGSGEYRLRREDGALRIAAKKVVVINDPVSSGRLPVV